ncbi:MmyB family transcriptional regulator [Nocardia asiatica]|uniref:MmyB family transcriptional regulator n=1 Tax=Nocardia asiatica TaxID=209252 RepID=UPI003EDF1CF7
MTQAVRTILDSMPMPAYLVDATYEVLAWNRSATPFVGDLATVAGHERNMVRWMFHLPSDDPRWSDEETAGFARSTVADLRAAYARYPGNPDIAHLVTELLGSAPRFAEMWADHEVRVRRTHRKNIQHPELGELEFECQVLHISDTDQRMIVYCATPGSPTAHIFETLVRTAD